MSEKNHPPGDDEVEHIQESTLIPESHFSTMMDDPNEQVSVIPESNASTVNQGEKPMAAAVLKKDASFAKKNAPYIAVAAVAGVLVVAFALKGGGGNAQPQVAQVPAAVVVQQPAPAVVAVTPAATQTTTGAAPVSAPVEINNASVPGSPAALETPTSVVALSGTPAAATTVAPITANTVMPSEVTATPVVPATVAPATVVTTVPAADINRIEGNVKTNSTEIVDLKTRVERLENGRTTSAGTGTAGAAENAAVKEIKKPVVLTAAQRARQRDAAAARLAAREANNSKNAALRATAATYSVHIVRDNLAWIRSPSGVISSYSVGDSIPGLGKLSKINELSHTVVAGNLTIK